MSGVTTNGLMDVWILPGCSVCGLCEAVAPGMFQVTDKARVVQPGSGLSWADFARVVADAAVMCPVDVIRFTRAVGEPGSGRQHDF